MAQQQEQNADVQQTTNNSPAAEASLAAHNEIYTPPVDQSASKTSDLTASSKPADQPANGSDGSSSSSTKTGNDALGALDGSVTSSDKTIFSPAEQAARQLRGVFASAEMGINDPEHGLSAQSVLNNGTHFDYHPGERADGLTSASRRLLDGGQQLSKTFDGRDDNLKAEVRFDSKTENSIGRQYESGRGPGGLTEESYRKAVDTEDSFRKYENRGDGLSSESYSNAIGIKQYERVFEDAKGPDGLLRDAKVRTADGSIDMEFRKFDPKVNKDGLAFESVAQENGAKVTNRSFESRVDGLVSENITLANGKSVSQKEFTSGETQIKRGDAVFQLGENGKLLSVTKQNGTSHQLDDQQRITETKRDGVTAKFEYEGDSRTPKSIDVNGRKFDVKEPENASDRSGLVLTTRGDGTETLPKIDNTLHPKLGGASIRVEGQDGNLNAVVRPNGDTIKFGYKLDQQKDPLNRSGQPSEITTTTRNGRSETWGTADGVKWEKQNSKGQKTGESFEGIVTLDKKDGTLKETELVRHANKKDIDAVTTTTGIDGQPRTNRPEGDNRTPQNERKVDIDARLDEIKKSTEGPITTDKADAVRRQFQNLSPEEIQLMKRGFDANNPDALGQHIKDSFSKLPGGLDKHAHRLAEVDGNLKRTGAPGEEAAISLRVGALEAQQAGGSGNRSLEAIQADTRRALLGSSENQRKDIDESLKKLYGDQNGGLKELYETGPGKALRGNDPKDFNNSVLDLATKKGVDARTPAEQADLLFKAHATGNIANFREVAGKEAMTDAGRKHFAENGGPEAIDQQVKKGRSTSELYSRDEKQELKEIAKFGKETELTAFRKGTGFIKNTDDALADSTKKTGADPKQKAMYLEGRELAKTGKHPETAQQKEASEFYQDWQKAFNQAHILNKSERAKEYERNIIGPDQPKNLKESIAESKDQKGLISALKGASPEEQKRLKTDTDYQTEIRDELNKATINPYSRAASNLILDRHIQGKVLSAADNTMIGALEKVANSDLSRHETPREVTRAIRDGLKQDKDGSLAKELLGNENFKRIIGDAVGNARRYHTLIKPLLETGAIPERQARKFHGVGTPEYFRDTVLDATPQGLKHLNSPEGKRDREAILGSFEPARRQLAERIIGQGEVKNEDRFRAFNLGIEKQDTTIDLLKKLDPQERGEAIRGYRKSFGEDLKESLLKNVDKANKPAVDLLANENALTGDQALINSRKHVTDSTTGWLAKQSLKSDSAPLNGLSDLTKSHRENEGRLSPEEVEQKVKGISDKLKSFEGTKEELANMITESVITTGSLAAAPFTGGTSLALLNLTTRVGTASLAGGLTGSLLKGQLTGDFSKIPGDVLKYGTMTGASLLGAESITALSGLGTRVATRTAEKAFSNPAVQGLTPELKEQVTKGLGDLVQKGFTSGGVKDDAVKGLVDGLKGLTPESKDALTKSLTSNLGTSVREVASDSLKGHLINAGKAVRTGGLEGTAAYGGDTAGEIVRQYIEKGEVDVPSAARDGINSFLLGGGLRGTAEGARLHRRHKQSGEHTSSGEHSTQKQEQSAPTTDSPKAPDAPRTADVPKAQPEQKQVEKPNYARLLNPDEVAQRYQAKQAQEKPNRLIHNPEEIAARAKAKQAQEGAVPKQDEITRPLPQRRDDEITKPLVQRREDEITKPIPPKSQDEITRPLPQKSQDEVTRPLERVGHDKPADNGRPSDRARVIDKSVLPREAGHEGKAVVDKPSFNEREYKIGNHNLYLWEEGKWFYGKKNEVPVAPLKIHVTTDGPKDLGRLQEALLPELATDPVLKGKVEAWKTFDPLHGVGRGNESGYPRPREEAQNAKAFTIYLRDNADAKVVQERIDQILVEKGLSLREPHKTGNVDIIKGQSNRVGISRDSFDAAFTNKGELAAKLDDGLQGAIRDHFGVREGRKLTDQQLRDAEKHAKILPNTLAHDNEGNLVLKAVNDATYPYNPAGKNKVYISEATAEKTEGAMTDRPAYFALLRKFNVDPVEVAKKRK